MSTTFFGRAANITQLTYSPAFYCLRPAVRARVHMASATSFYDFKPLDYKGSPYPTAELKGRTVLVVNLATKCGFTPQLEGLEKLYREIKALPNGASFEILGFPCNQFGGQNAEDDDGTQTFCQINYGVTFPILGKTDVNGGKAEPLWEWMKKQQPGLLGLQSVKWNFEKFLVGKDGNVKARWASTTKPETLKKPIEQELGSDMAEKSEL